MLRRISALALAAVFAADASAKPNVIVVMTDDQGYGEFSCHGNPVARTPHIDRLAAESVRLTDFHVAPMCTPTRGQLMTGLDAFRNGAVNVSSGRTLLRPELKTMADVFKAAGYRTGLFGKWHLGDNYPFRPQDRGFDEALWFPSSHVNSVPDFWDNDYFDDTYLRNGRREKVDGYCTDVFFREAMRWMAAAEDDRPFFAYIALNAAHSPLFVPEKYRGPVRRALAARPEVLKRPRRRQALISFLAMGANIDEDVGRLDRFLAAKGLKEDTVVVFLTDNGSTMGLDYFNAGMRGWKTTLWEGGHRVPCFIRWPAGGLKPRELNKLCQVQDLLPTLAELAGVADIPEDLDGRSLASLLRGGPDTLGDRMLVINYSRMPGFRVKYTKGNPAVPRRDGAAVLWRRWRLIENRELYDLRSDPPQKRDVAAERPEVVAEMRAHLNAWWARVKETALEPQRVVVGGPESPTRLTACEWLDVFVDQQKQVRRGVRKNGTWHLKAARAGDYTLELRRYPAESGLGLADGVKATRVVDGVYPAGPAFDVAAARVQVNGRTLKRAVPRGSESVTFRVRLPAGPFTLRTWLTGRDGKDIGGAYYVTVSRGRR